jgi:hypothetical protein
VIVATAEKTVNAVVIAHVTNAIAVTVPEFQSANVAVIAMYRRNNNG